MRTYTHTDIHTFAWQIQRYRYKVEVMCSSSVVAVAAVVAAVAAIIMNIYGERQETAL